MKGLAPAPEVFRLASAQVGSLESSPRIRCSQADHPVTGRIGSVHPIGHPIIQSEKFGLKVRSLAEDLGPAFKVRWRGREKGKLKGFVGRAPQAFINSQICVQSRAAFPSANCDPVWLGSFLSRKQSFTSISSTLLE